MLVMVSCPNKKLEKEGSLPGAYQFCGALTAGGHCRRTLLTIALPDVQAKPPFVKQGVVMYTLRHSSNVSLLMVSASILSTLSDLQLT